MWRAASCAGSSGRPIYRSIPSQTHQLGLRIPRNWRSTTHRNPTQHTQKRREGAAFKNNLKWKNLNRRASSRLRSAARIRSGRQSRMASVVKPAFKIQILHPGRAIHIALRDVDFVGPGVPIARSTPQAGRRAVQLVTIPGGAHFCRGALRRNARDVHQRY